jgi:DNA-binding CsgD family transcriptional regulator
MKVSDEHIELEAAIYEAAIIPELWPAALTELNRLSETGGTAMVCINERGVHMMTTANMAEIGRRFVDEDWISRNSRAGAAFAKGIVGLPRFAPGEELQSEEEHLADPMINELFRPYGFGRVAGFITQLPHGDTIIMNVEQYWDRGPVRGKSLQTLDDYYPHLARSALMAGRADFRRVQTAVETLSALGIPAVAVTPTGRVVLANPQFESSTHVWNTRGGEKLALRDRTADRMLASALEALSALDSPRSIPVREVAGSRVTGVLQIIPIRRTAHDVFGSCSAIVVLSEARQEGREATLVQSLFDLTAAELAIATDIAAGETVARIAQKSGRSINTVRNQLASILHKTGCSRQSELVILMNQLSGRLV